MTGDVIHIYRHGVHSNSDEADGVRPVSRQDLQEKTEFQVHIFLQMRSEYVPKLPSSRRVFQSKNLKYEEKGDRNPCRSRLRGGTTN